jgi:hypothetical protein
MNEENQFLDELKENNPEDPFGEVVIPSEEKAVDVEPEDAPDDVKNRRHRRLEQKYQAEREANIAMAARLETLAEATKTTQSDSEYLKSIERIYGTDTPEAQTATELLRNALQGAKNEARDEALQIFREEQQKASEATRKEEQVLDSMIEEIEDQYNVTFTPDMQKGFFTYLERLSPKGKDGNVTEYADHHAVWDEYKAKIAKRPDNRAKDLSSRSMTQSGTTGESKLAIDATERFLRENDLI